MKDKLKSALEEATKSITGEEVVDESTEKSVEAKKDVQSGKSSTDLGKHQSETSKSEDTDTDDEVADSKDKKDKDKDSAKKDVQSGKSSTDLSKHQSETKKSADEEDDSDDDSEDDKSAKKDVQSGKSSTDLSKHQSETKKSVDEKEDTDVKSIVEKSISNYFENEEANKSVDYVTADDMSDIIKSLSIAMKKSIVDVVSKSVKEAVKDITGTQTQTQAADLSSKKSSKKSKSKKEPEGETGDSGNAGSKINTNTDVEESCDTKKSIDDSGVEHVEDTKNEKPVIGKSVQGIEPEKNGEEVEKSVNSSKSVHTASDWANTTLLKSADARLFARKNGLLSNELDRNIDGINEIASKSMSGNNLEMAQKSLKDLKSLVDNTKGFEKFELLN